MGHASRHGVAHVGPYSPPTPHPLPPQKKKKKKKK